MSEGLEITTAQALFNPIAENVTANCTNLTHADFELLKTVTTNVRDYDPFDENNKGKKFIPVLEGRNFDADLFDKNEQGLRKDTMPIANAVADSIQDGLKINCAVFQFLEEEGMPHSTLLTNSALKAFLAENAHGIIVRNNPGTLTAKSQKKFDDMLRDLSESGVNIMTHPDVMSTLGAKDALVKIRDLNCGLEDTEVYYDPKSFIDGFRKSIAFQPRVIKQNRGSQGQGIWIVKAKDGNYCSKYGESIIPLDAELVLIEAWDNHTEYHTVQEFLEFCIHGRTNYSGVWASISQGRYFDGGVEAGSMIVDQRFLPRIVEGEVRCLFVGSHLAEIVHKKPKEGGLSATLSSGAVYTRYTPDAEKFVHLVDHLKKDVPRIMASFGMFDRPLPLLWAADYIYGDTDEELYIGEINCTCPGISRQLQIVPIIAKVAIDTVFPESQEVSSFQSR